MAVFLGPRHIIAVERDDNRKARDMACNAPIILWGAAASDSPSASASASEVFGARWPPACTRTGIQPPGAWVMVSSSMPRRCGIEGPVRSMSRIPTDFPARQRERAS